MAVDDDFLRKNPLAFELASAIVNDSVTREANTRKQQIDLFDKIRDRSETLQYILGHADISVALNTYIHVKFDMQRKKYIG
ncbi:hypothetical protein MKC76_16295 [[Clostridium] innocuum]|nr:hypothetical protein [[Clostridium] innocuum]MCR0446331.1 hypothetical protein [[Clostridium] innocuum]